MAATNAVTTTGFCSYNYFRDLRLRFRVPARERLLVKRAFRMDSRAMTAVIKLTTEVASLIASSMLM